MKNSISIIKNSIINKKIIAYISVYASYDSISSDESEIDYISEIKEKDTFF